MAEFTEARQGYGIAVDRSYLNRTPMGDFIAVYLEGDDSLAGNRAFAVVPPVRCLVPRKGERDSWH
jgi:hypothetical protein